MGRELVFDAWTPMSFKRVMGNRTQPGITYEQPTWVGEHSRRLMAYKVLQAYVDNAAREFLATTDEAKIEEHREYGDAALIRDTILAALLGEDQEIVVPGAEDESADEDTEADPDADAKVALQDWLREQWRLERGRLKVQEGERDAVGLGDGVHTLGWDEEKGRVRWRVWDPGFYFPVLHDGNEDDYPDKVHVAWEVPRDERETSATIEVRRITWELVDWDEWTPAYADEPTSRMCVYTDATFKLERGRVEVDSFDRASATFATGPDGEPLDEVEMGIDFVPVVHVPNTVAIKNHYGKSSIATVLQILDDLANADTDLQAASATAGKPVMTLSGGTLGKKAPTYNPGEVWEVGDGQANWLDTSANLSALIGYVEFLLKRLSVNARTPDALLGRIAPSEVPSGVALALGFGPLAAMVTEMRLSRGEKYPLLLKFVWRMSLANGAEGVPPTWFDAELELGSYLPQDQAAVVTQVTTLLTARAISRETGVKMLMAAGLPIEDAVEEVARIAKLDFEGATRLREAVDSDEAVLDYLGMEKPADLEKPEPPEVVVPPPPPPGTQPVPPNAV